MVDRKPGGHVQAHGDHALGPVAKVKAAKLIPRAVVVNFAGGRGRVGAKVTVVQVHHGQRTLAIVLCCKANYVKGGQTFKAQFNSGSYFSGRRIF